MKAWFLTFLFFSLLGCAVRRGNDGTGIFKLEDNNLWLFGNASAVYYFDKQQNLDFPSIQKLKDKDWISTAHNTSFGILPEVIWFQLDIENNTKVEDWIINIENAELRRVDFYYPTLNLNDYKIESSGISVPISEMSIPNRLPIFPFHIKTNSKQRIYFRFDMSTRSLLPLRFFTQSSYFKFETFRGFVAGAYYGAMLLLLLYNLVLFFSMKDKLFLYYCTYLFFFTCFVFTINRQWMPLIDLSSIPWIQRMAPALSMLTTIAALVFAKAFLFPDKEKGKVKSIIIFALVLQIITFPFTLFSSVGVSVFLANISPAIGIFAVSIAAVMRFREGFSGARYFIIAWSFLLVSVLLFISMNLGLIDFSNFVSYGPMYGSVLEGIFLSLGIGDRINRLKKEREDARKALLESQLKALDEEKKINESISRFVPNQFLEILQRKTIVDVYRGDSVEKKLSILFTDIRNFTQFSESRPAKDVFYLLNEYMEQLGPIIASNNGFVDKYIGDAIMALFPNSPEDAVQAALQMRTAVLGMRNSIFKDFHLDAGYGIHYGNVMLGTVGGLNRLDTTVIGDHVNLASRLEGLTKTYSIPLIVSDSIRRNISKDSSLDFREIDSVIVKGKSIPIVIYEVLNVDSLEIREAKLASYSVFFEALQEYKEGDPKKALSSFEECVRLCPHDTVALTYIERIKGHSQTRN